MGVGYIEFAKGEYGCVKATTVSGNGNGEADAGRWDDIRWLRWHVIRVGNWPGGGRVPLSETSGGVRDGRRGWGSVIISMAR